MSAGPSPDDAQRLTNTRDADHHDADGWRLDPGAIDGTHVFLGLLDDSDAAAPLLDAPVEGKPIEVYGDAGSRRYFLQGGGGFHNNNSSNSLLLGGGGLSWFIANGLSLDLELNGMYFNQEQSGDDAVAVNINMIFRYHVVRARNWSFYIDGGPGVMIATDEVPPGGSNFNFTPQGGFGFSIDVGHDVRLLVGTRWLHVSNANLYEDNPGRDSVLIYGQVSVPF